MDPKFEISVKKYIEKVLAPFLTPSLDIDYLALPSRDRGGDQNVENENVEHTKMSSTKMSSIPKCRGPGDAR